MPDSISMCRVTVRLPQAEKDAIHAHCESLGISMNSYCRIRMSTLTDEHKTLLSIEKLTQRLEDKGVI